MSARNPLPSAEFLREILEYNQESGTIVWRSAFSRRVPAGHAAGTINSNGYRIIRINDKGYTAHRLAWKIVTGDDPENDIDHINGIRSDNRWSNLRPATPAQNIANRARLRTNRTGFKGVSVIKQSPNRWASSIRLNGVPHYLGIFKSPQLAHEAYMKAAREFYGEYATDRAEGRSSQPPTTRQSI